MSSRPVGWWRRLAPADRAFAGGLLAFLPLFVWWLGWYPGFLSSDSVDQWGQVVSFDFTNLHPAVHTWLMWLVTRVWVSPGMVTLVQAVLMAVVLAFGARRMTQLGAGPGISAGLVAGMAALPAVSITTLALWKDVPYTIALIWLFVELLGLELPRSPRASRWLGARIGLAMSLIWLLRHNGFITIVLFVPVLAWVLRHRPQTLTIAGGVLVAGILAVNVVLYPVIGVERTSIEPAGVFVSDVAASFVHEPGNFTADETAYLLTIAPRAVWVDRYDCTNSTPLAFDPAFDGSVITADAARFRNLVIRTYLRDPDTVLGHRWCAASYLLVPPQPAGAYFHRPPFAIPENPDGVVRDPLVDPFYRATLGVFEWIEPPGRLWLTWRPAIAVWAGLTALVWAIRRGRWRPLLPAVALLLAQGLNVAATTPAQEFRFAFGIYLMSLLLAVAAYAVTRSGRSAPGYRPGGDA